MATFHARADRSPRIDAHGGGVALRGRWVVNIEQTRPCQGTVLDASTVDTVGSLALRFLDGRSTPFADRVAHARVVDGHGDLIADDVFCLDDGPRVLDCLEFEDLLRYVDGLDDVAFLAMDLERLADRTWPASSSATMSSSPEPIADGPAPPLHRLPGARPG